MVSSGLSGKTVNAVALKLRQGINKVLLYFRAHAEPSHLANLN